MSLYFRSDMREPAFNMPPSLVALTSRDIHMLMHTGNNTFDMY